MNKTTKKNNNCCQHHSLHMSKKTIFSLSLTNYQHCITVKEAELQQFLYTGKLSDPDYGNKAAICDTQITERQWQQAAFYAT